MFCCMASRCAPVGPFLFSVLLLAIAQCMLGADVDVLIRNGTIYDGSGGPGRVGDLAILKDRIVAIPAGGEPIRARTEIDARGLAVAPGFINMLSWANESL